jgi:hypothetical protein
VLIAGKNYLEAREGGGIWSGKIDKTKRKQLVVNSLRFFSEDQHKKEQKETASIIFEPASPGNEQKGASLPL